MESRRVGSLPRLRAIVRYGVGLDNIDLEAADERGLIVRNVANYCIDEVADHALAFIVSANRRLGWFDRSVKRGEWAAASSPTPLAPRSDPVGLAGYGRIGRALGLRLRALGFPVLVWDPLATGKIEGATRVETLIELAARSNHLSLHIPLSAATQSLVDGPVLSALGPLGHLVNTARGGLVDERSLLAALQDERLGWASLDVLGSEPPRGTALELIRHSRVSGTPHVAYLSTDSPSRLRRLAAQALRDALASGNSALGRPS